MKRRTMLQAIKLYFTININNTVVQKLNHVRNISSYVQGQSPEPRIREYFYYIDHQGMLFLDDARMKNFTSCFKEKQFLKFFFGRLQLNNTDRYKEFHYLSPCGRERNFVRCDDYPIVYTHLVKIKNNNDTELHLSYNHIGDLLTHKFYPEKIYMLPETGRVYHPAPEKVGSIGLIASKLAIELSKYFTFDNGETEPPTLFEFEGKIYKLDMEWYKNAVQRNKRLNTS